MMSLKNDGTNNRIQTVVMLAVLIFLNLLIYFLVNTLVTEDVLYQYMTTQLDHDIAMEQIRKINRTGFILLKYLLQGIWILLKIGGITLIVMLGLFAFNIKAAFSEIFQVMLLPSLIFLIPDVLKIAWFNLLQTDYQMNDLNNFPRFSLSELVIALDLVPNEGFSSLLKRFLQPITVANLLFCWAVAVRLRELKPDDKNVFKSVFISYFTLLTVFSLTLHGVIKSFAP